MDIEPLPDVGVVGLTTAGQKYAATAMELDCSVVGADANEQTRQQAQDELGIETYADFKTMFQSGIDAVIVATPNRYHETAAIPALEADLDVFFEKPLAHTYESAERIADAAADTDSVCMVGYYFPCYEAVDVIKAHVEARYFGEISHVEARWVQRRAVPRRGSWYTSSEIAGGGVLQDKGSFLLHLLSYFGYPVEEIEVASGKARSEFGNRDDYTSLRMWGGYAHENIFDVEDSISTFVQFEGGKTATIEAAWAANLDSEVTLHIRGTDGGASLNVGTGDVTFYGVERGDPECLTTTDVEPDYAEELFHPDEDGPTTGVFRRRVFQQFLHYDSREDQPEHTTIQEAARVQQAIQDIYDGVDDDI